MNLQEFLNIIKNKSSAPGYHERMMMLELGTLTQSNQFKEKIDQQTNRFIINSLRAGVKSKTKFIQILCSTIMYNLSNDYRYLQHMERLLINKKESIAYDMANLNAITSLLFNASEENRDALSSIFHRGFQRDLFYQILGKAKKLAKALKLEYTSQKAHKNRVAILIQQFLMPPHAPTKDALEFARFLIENYDKEVMIVNTCEFNSNVNGAFVPPFKANVVKDYSNVRVFDYSGLSIPVFQPVHTGFEDQGIVECLEAINAFCPGMVLTIGCRNVLSELYSDSIFSFMYPTAATLPFTKGNYFHTWHKATEGIIKLSEEEGILEQYLFEQHPGFETPKQINKITRSELDIPESAFVFVVVGMRLHNVVDDAFLDLLEKITSEPSAHVLFAGYFNSYGSSVGGRDKLKGRCTFAGFHSDIMSVYEICDAYINPKQPGGGSAIVYAMASGLPALSLPFGDGGLAVEKLPVIKNYRELASVAKQFCSDKSFYGRYKTMTEDIASELSSRAPLVNKIMNAFSAYQGGTLRSEVSLNN